MLMTRDGFTFLAMGFTGPRAAVFKEAYIEAFNKAAPAALRWKLTEIGFIFFSSIPYLCTSLVVKWRVKIGFRPLPYPLEIPGFYVGPKVDARRREKGFHKVYNLLGFDRKIFEGLRGSTRRRFPPWRGQKIGIGEKWEGYENFSYPWLRSEGWGYSQEEQS